MSKNTVQFIFTCIMYLSMHYIRRDIFQFVNLSGEYLHLCFTSYVSHPNIGGAVVWWLRPRTPDPEVGGLSPTRVAVLCP